MDENIILLREEALEYVTDKLKIPDIEAKLEEDRTKALNEIIRAFHSAYPFQNLDLVATPEEERRVPSLAEIRSSFLLCKGGLCLSGNLAMKVLLDRLGFDTYLANGGVTHPTDHTLVVVKNLKNPGDLHLVDVSSGFPTLEAANLRNCKEVYQSSYLTWTIEDRGGGNFCRVHLRGDPREVDESDASNVSMDNKITDENGEIISDRKTFYTFSVEPRNLDYFYRELEPTYTKVSYGIMLVGLFYCLYTEDKGITIVHDQLRVFNNHTGIIERDEILNSAEEYLKAFKEMGVIVDEDEVRKAYNTIQKYKEAHQKD